MAKIYVRNTKDRTEELIGALDTGLSFMIGEAMKQKCFDDIFGDEDAAPILLKMGMTWKQVKMQLIEAAEAEDAKKEDLDERLSYIEKKIDKLTLKMDELLNKKD